MTWCLSPTEKDFSFQNCTVRWYLDLTISHRFGTHLHHNKKHNEPTSEKRIIEGRLVGVFTIVWNTKPTGKLQLEF
jgi:hypothetical protein